MNINKRIKVIWQGECTQGIVYFIQKPETWLILDEKRGEGGGLITFASRHL